MRGRCEAYKGRKKFKEHTHKVAADGGGVCEGEADGLLRVDDEDSTNGEREALRIPVRRVLVVQHVVQRRDLAIAVRDLQSLVSPSVLPQSQRLRTMGNCTSVGLVVSPPYLLMSFTQSWCFCRSSAEIPMTFTLRFLKSSARRATSPSSVVHTGVKSPGWEKRMACEYKSASHPRKSQKATHPRVADPVVELDRARGRLCLKVGRDVAEAQSVALGHSGYEDGYEGERGVRLGRTEVR